MADLTVKHEWTLGLTTPELRLILKALGGRLKAADIDVARELGDLLTKDRVHVVTQSLRQSEQLLNNLEG